MCTIIRTNTTNSGFHPIQYQSHRAENWMGPEWVEVPPDFLDLINDGWCDLTIEDGVLVGATPKERPPEPHRYTYLELTQQNITDLELTTIEQGQNMTDLELMILEGYHV